MTNESAVLHAAIQYLTLRGAVVFRNNTGMQKAEYKGKTRVIRYGLGVGSSDIVGVYQGRFLAVETKYGRNRPTEEQLAFLATIREAGGVGVWCNEQNYVEVIDAAIDGVQRQEVI